MLRDIFILVFLFRRVILGIILVLILLLHLSKNSIENSFVRVLLCFVFATLIIFAITICMFDKSNWEYG